MPSIFSSPPQPRIQNDTPTHTNTIPYRSRYSCAPRALELQLGVGFCARPSLEPPAHRQRSRRDLGVCGPYARTLAAAGRAFTAEPRRGAFVDKQSVCSFGFLLFSLIFCLLLNLPLRSSFFSNFPIPSSFSLSFRSLFFPTLSLPLFCPSFSVSPSPILAPSLPLGPSFSLGLPSRTLRCPVVPSPYIIFPDSAAFLTFLFSRRPQSGGLSPAPPLPLPLQ